MVKYYEFYMILQRTIVSFILLFGTCLVLAQVTESVLSNGEIYKVTISKSGIYKIDREYLAEHNIVIPSRNRIHIYGQKGGVLPELLADVRSKDLVEFPLYEVNVNGGPLGSDAYILFYAEGADVWRVRDNSIEYEKNIYDKNNYVFLVLNNADTRKIEISESPNSADYISRSYDEVQRYEEDKANPLGIFPTTHGSGQEWYGDEFSNLRQKDYSDRFDFENRDISSEIHVKSEFVSRSASVTSYELHIDNQVLTQSVGSVRTGDIEAIHARKARLDATLTISNPNPKIFINYPAVNATSKGWLDYIQIQFRKDIVYNGMPLILRDKVSVEHFSSQFDVRGAISTNTQVWDISNTEIPFAIKINGSSFSYESQEQLRTFIIFNTDNTFDQPGEAEKIENQDLHGITDADMIIIYDKNWEEAAIRLATHRSTYSELSVETVEISDVYNEFSSGRQDPTAIRDFAKMVRDRSENFRYLLLFGDGSYDYRGIDESLPKQSFVPTYETKESLDPLEAFPSDDYFAQLDDNEGDELRGDLDIAVGRLPARNEEEAENFVNKLIAYDLSKESFGNWRSRIAFLADDEDSNLHLNDADVIAKKVLNKHPIFNQKKIYWDAYLQESTPGGNRYPAANAQLNNDIEEGLLVVNYLGHGGPKGWSQERVLNLDDITSWSNLEKLPLVVTATCSFTGFDDPSLTTAGEACIHNPSGGAIALFTTVRSVFASQNFRLTEAVFDTLFTKVDGDYMTIGEVMQRAKNTRKNDVVNARKFFLIGDPSMKLAIPGLNVETVEFDNKEIGIDLDTIGALQRINAKAVITDPTGKTNTFFNGVADITLFDKASRITTLRNDPSSFEKEFDIQKNILFTGRVKVVAGEMDFSFIVPLDIDYNYGKGRISYYAVSDEGLDAAGYFDDFVIGGTADNVIMDNEGPDIAIKLNTETFQSGDQISQTNPVVNVDFFDESGINVSNVSIGHEIIGILDEDTGGTQVLNEKYTSDIDNFKNGNLSYRLDDLELGHHSLTIRAFDILNNPGEETIQFEVIENLDGLLSNVIAYPNPFESKIQFDIENEIGGPVNVIIEIFDINGKLISEITANGLTNQGVINTLSWDGQGHFGPVVGGIYFYEVTLNAINSEKTLSSGLKKIIVLK